ncbi:hypothetical protein LD125_00572 [Mesoplasma sp. JKS002658]|uniref:hypothetical protein n=1 Tax=Mesoplasma whartonense TaxID=2878854 RepID=UPI002022A0B4|nr:MULTISPECIES: hypothetical protein [unclassified Mesoplasma]MCL8211310.1 hypothetical protein [Mesoplasma sp. JKS002664]MCL8212163.1 hypothetical protein [Mesoplasma sp. JKS002662]MCL8212573.1 hypothetical protein [Mesoplasma sp. JKS002661]MCL8213305.1 hypothetical protein [Mesoplasma sp. JKS002660]MCL8214308.1 hypothetical protein [Mesoplasma sp. JKS002658]
MKKLTIQAKKQIKAGKGVSGSFLSGLGSIFKAIGGFITDTISTIATTVFMFNDHQHHDKVTYKLGNNQISIDDSKSNSLNHDNHSDDDHQVKLAHTTPTTQLHLEDPYQLGQEITGGDYGGPDFT